MPVRALLSASRRAKEPIGRRTDRVNRPGQCRSAPIAIQLSDDQAAISGSIDVPARSDPISALHRRSRTARVFRSH